MSRKPSNGSRFILPPSTACGLDLRFEKCVDMKFGPIPVQLRQDVRRRDSAFVSAGSEVYRFDMPHGNFKATQLVFTAKDRTIQVRARATPSVGRFTLLTRRKPT